MFRPGPLVRSKSRRHRGYERPRNILRTTMETDGSLVRIRYRTRKEAPDAHVVSGRVRMSMNLCGVNARRGLAVLLPLGLLSFGLAVAKGEAPKVREKKTVIRIDPPSQTTFLGVEVEESSEQPEGGAHVTHVVPDSPASRAGLEEGDVVVQLDDEPVRGPAGLTRQIRARAPGDEVSIVVLRDGHKRTLQTELAPRSAVGGASVFKIDDLDLNGLEGLEGLDLSALEQLGESLEGLDLSGLEQLGESLEGLDLSGLEHLGESLEGLDLDHLAEGAEGHRIRIFCRNGDCKRYGPDESDRPLLGVQVVDTTPELNRHLGGAERGGVLISKVIDGSAADAAGIGVGDLLVSIAGQEVSDVGDVRRAIGDKAGERVQVEVIRDRAARTIEVQLPELDPESD